MARGRPRKTDDVLLKSAEMIGWALGGIEREIAETRTKLTALTAQAAQLRSRVGLKGTRGAPTEAGSAVVGAGDVAEVTGRKRRRRKMSPEARKRISEMMKKRWAERKRAK